MPVTAKLRYLRISPRKVRLVADLIRKKKVEEAQTLLNFTTKRAARHLLKLLKTAVADAKNNFQLNPDNLYISKITVDEGPKYKRWRARARGAAYEIQKKTSHVTLILEEISPTKKTKKKTKKEKTYQSSQKETKEAKETKEVFKIEKPKPKPETEIPKPKGVKGIKRFFRRKAF